MIRLICLSILFAANVTHADPAAMPKPTVPQFISANAYPEIKQYFAPPPAKGSEAQQKDEATLRDLQKSRTSQDCARANSEVKVSFEKFFGKPYGPLTDSELKALKPVMTDALADAKFFVMKVKSEYDRQRPFAYISGLTPCVPKEWTGAYPSWHASSSELMALVAGEVIPKKADELLSRSVQIAGDRVLGGVHHPTDIEAGKAIAREIFSLLDKSPKFKAEIDTAKKSL